MPLCCCGGSGPRSGALAPAELERRIELLKGVKLFANMHRHELEHVASVLTVRRFRKNAAIIREGAKGADFFIIDSGEALEVDVIDDDEEEEEAGPLDAIRASLFGALSQNSPVDKTNAPNAAQVEKTETPPPQLQQNQQTKNGENNKAAVDLHIKPGGCKELHHAHTHVEKMQFGPGSYFGERALLRPESKRKISVKALTQCRTYMLHADDFRTVIHERNVREELVRGCHLFETCNEKEVAAIAGALQRESYSAGDSVLRQGGVADCMYIVEKGECVASIQAEDGVSSDVATYTSGGLFGERALLEKDAKRAASIRSSTESLLLRLDRSDFEGRLGSLENLHAQHYLTDPRRLLADFYACGGTKGPKGCYKYEPSLRGTGFDPVDKAVPASEPKTEWIVIYRPCSRDSIAKMLGRVGVGKGLNVKGKSAKKNRLSGFVPFIQISDNAHKARVEPAPPRSRIHIFYRSAEDRAAAESAMHALLHEPDFAAKLAKAFRPAGGSSSSAGGNNKDTGASKDTNASGNNAGAGSTSPSSDKDKSATVDVMALVRHLDDYIECSSAYGLDVPELLLREVYIERHDISPMLGWETGRVSEPAFMDMNLHAVRDPQGLPRACVLQHDLADPLNPLGLLVAYEEACVHPVVSDFDTLLIASRGPISYDALPAKQVELQKWCLQQTRQLLETQAADDAAGRTCKSWTSNWLQVLTAACEQGNFNPGLPTYGFGDPTSIDIIAKTVAAMAECGAVRHGAECFNFLFPQEQDDQYLVIWDKDGGDNITDGAKTSAAGTTAPASGIPTSHQGGPPSRTKPTKSKSWFSVTEPELRAFLADRVADGFVFPLNPAWPARDPVAWGPIWRALQGSEAAQQANQSWYRQEIVDIVEELMKTYPEGFRSATSAANAEKATGSAAPAGVQDASAGARPSQTARDEDRQGDEVASMVHHHMQMSRQKRMKRIRTQLLIALRQKAAADAARERAGAGAQT
ncbi:unnamed protein product [Amoebophrya sp. A120]|nr:unnamed protein product [Amoebophrya sp. A120]|eukprot:GSA120T00005275001.1